MGEPINERDIMGTPDAYTADKWVTVPERAMDSALSTTFREFYNSYVAARPPEGDDAVRAMFKALEKIALSTEFSAQPGVHAMLKQGCLEDVLKIAEEALAKAKAVGISNDTD